MTSIMQSCIEELAPVPHPDTNSWVDPTPPSPSQGSMQLNQSHETSSHVPSSSRQNQSSGRILEEKKPQPKGSPRGRLQARTRDSKPQTARSESPGPRKK